MRKSAGGGWPEKRRGGKRQSAVTPRRSFAAVWRETASRLLPGARPEIARLVREVHAYTEAERSVDPTALRRWRERRRRQAAAVVAAVPRLLDALRTLRSWTELIGLDAQTAMLFRSAALRFEADWGPYLYRLRGRAAWLAPLPRNERRRHHPRQKRRRPNYVLEVVVARLIHIIETHGRDPKAALLVPGEGNEPDGVLFDVAVALRDLLPCFPRGDAALYRALCRARSRAREHQRAKDAFART